jgi:hypothetical protein
VGTLIRAPVLRREADLFLSVSRAVRDRCGLGSEERRTVIPNFARKRPPRTRDDRRLDQLPRDLFVLFFGDLMREEP